MEMKVYALNVAVFYSAVNLKFIARYRLPGLIRLFTITNVTLIMRDSATGRVWITDITCVKLKMRQGDRFTACLLLEIYIRRICVYT